MTARAITSAPHPPRDGEVSAVAVARFVREQIFEGKFAPDQRLPQDDIAEFIGVSRIPVREAIIALEREGWLRVERHRGAFVNVLDDQAVLDRFALYGRFYGFAARRTLERMSRSDLDALGGLATRIGHLSKPAAFEPVSNLYMSTLVTLSASARLRAVLRSTAQIVPGNFFARVPNSIAIQKAGVAELQTALEADDATAAEHACEAMEHRHALQVISLLHTLR